LKTIVPAIVYFLLKPELFSIARIFSLFNISKILIEVLVKSTSLDLEPPIVQLKSVIRTLCKAFSQSLTIRYVSIGVF
jgi:hypothetical protein